MKTRVFLIFSLIITFLMIQGVEGAQKKQAQKLEWQDCLEIAFENNPDFRAAQLKLRQTEGQGLVLESQLLPKIGLRGSSAPVIFTITGTQLVASRATLPILTAGHAIRSAAHLNVELEALELVWKLRRAFAAALFHQMRKDLEVERASVLAKRLKRSPSLFEAGQLTRADLVSLEVKTSLAEQELARAKLDYEKALLSLADTMGITSKDPFFGKPLRAKFDLERKLAFCLQEYIDYAYQNRLDLQALGQLKLAADQRIYITNAQAWPALYAEGSLRVEETLPPPLDEMEKLLKPGNASSDEEEDNVKDVVNSTANAGMRISWRIFDGGSTLGQVRSARAQAVSQQVLLEQTEKAVAWQVRTAYEVFENLSHSLSSLEQKNASTRSLNLSQELFEQGLISQLEVLDAIEKDIEYRTGQLQVLYSMEVARAHLDYVTGYSTRFLPEASSQSPVQVSR